ncbi:hypothetical protein GCM10010170_079840 [Dactylosporangium salmoneum]|uniref:Uncharacterized protein n=1 Tax=Dactylosporangium salmoneum TaxID=53361 RepID=A0ABP5UBX8_9ACTN
MPAVQEDHDRAGALRSGRRVDRGAHLDGQVAEAGQGHGGVAEVVVEPLDLERPRLRGVGVELLAGQPLRGGGRGGRLRRRRLGAGHHAVPGDVDALGGGYAGVGGLHGEGETVGGLLGRADDATVDGELRHGVADRQRLVEAQRHPRAAVRELVDGEAVGFHGLFAGVGAGGRGGEAGCGDAAGEDRERNRGRHSASSR